LSVGIRKRGYIGYNGYITYDNDRRKRSYKVVTRKLPGRNVSFLIGAPMAAYSALTAQFG
jgi:hypothetical protein